MFRAIASTVIPEAADLDDEGWAELETLVRESLRARPPALRRRLRLFLLVVQYGPLLRYGRTFTSLKPPQRASFLTALQDHPIGLLRVGFWGVRTLALLGYYGRAAAAEGIGYRPHPRGWEAGR